MLGRSLHLPSALSALALLASCTGQAAEAPDATVDVAPDIRSDSDECLPGCHYDCFGGVGCIKGSVWIYGQGAIPCCRPGDPIPGDDSPAGPCAESDKPVHVCANRAGCARPADPRYERCAQKSAMVMPGSEIYYRVHCAGSSHRAGDSCQSDADCRPSATEARLRCELSKARCVETPRPKAPDGYGESCGLSSRSEEVVWVFPNARRELRFCHVAQDFSVGCVRQGMTMPCLLDEDCPAGSICLCDTYPVPVCARATDRETLAGRTAGLRCF